MAEKIIVMTGGTSGFGAITSKKLLQEPGTRLILGTRNKRIAGAEHLPLNLKSVRSVKEFSSAVISTIENKKIDVLICNAGISIPTVDTKTEDGFETTFAVNHLAHFLLIDLLKLNLADTTKIILTTSGTHNPDEGSRVAPPKHANIYWLAYPEKDETLDEKDKINAERAYASSKLCNLLTARYINTLTGNWEGIAYDPGPTPGTGLTQNLGIIRRILWKLFSISFLRKRVFPKSNSIEDAGKALADIALGKISIPAGKEYAALRAGKMTFPLPSELAQKDEVMEKVWNDSKEILNL
ncbi:SDR family NAD(P)-dependent oxidoreductase [Cytophagaceae bacterium DM2B3-1]|uniref:SDR family NAD(P)-dependent oxidoreductase n=1 Tax=Xanthocytophaga flava TaxID=3048013 RepID=A0ABT7CMS2_9BACT|nr:SDR family NAD(P)-dependent oxidoreductase [Xanthocytophaga flavus]MDJ1494982.1 SDR family NAD(P)-dependent oxidoreductase [Xanthocytophaga flavus]